MPFDQYGSCAFISFAGRVVSQHGTHRLSWLMIGSSFLHALTLNRGALCIAVILILSICLDAV